MHESSSLTERVFGFEKVNLRLLDLNDNMLSALPPEIGNLTSLKKLNLGGNLLKELPDEIGYGTLYHRTCRAT